MLGGFLAVTVLVLDVVAIVQRSRLLQCLLRPFRGGQGHSCKSPSPPRRATLAAVAPVPSDTLRFRL